MNQYLTAKNDRRRRRQARMLTALITLTLIALTAYATGAFDFLLTPAVPVVNAGVVAGA